MTDATRVDLTRRYAPDLDRLSALTGVDVLAAQAAAGQ